MKEFTTCMTEKYCCFSGRARRREYWMFVLISTILYFIALLIDNFILHSSINIGSRNNMGIVSLLVSLAMMLPALGVSVRRLHDTNRSWCWILIVLIPLIGEIWDFVLMVLPGNPGINKYGPNPKEDEKNTAAF